MSLLSGLANRAFWAPTGFCRLSHEGVGRGIMGTGSCPLLGGTRAANQKTKNEEKKVKQDAQSRPYHSRTLLMRAAPTVPPGSDWLPPGLGSFSINFFFFRLGSQVPRKRGPRNVEFWPGDMQITTAAKMACCLRRSRSGWLVGRLAGLTRPDS